VVCSRQPTLPPRRPSTGREPWVFRVKDPEGLPGRHAENMAASIHPGEKLHYLFYSPIWDGRCAPFGLEALPASHAVAVTGSRFIVSVDPHEEPLPISLAELPFQSLLSVEIGSALLLGWLSFRFVENDSVSKKTLLFRATGARHFVAAVRMYRSLTAWPGREPSSRPPLSWADVRARAPHSFSAVEALLLAEERPWTCAFSPPVWRTEGSKKTWVSTTPGSFFLVTTHGLFALVEEPGPHPDVLGYGLNLALFRFPELHSVQLTDPTEGSAPSAVLRLYLGSEWSSASLDFPVDERRIAEIRQFASMATELASRERDHALRRS